MPQYCDSERLERNWFNWLLSTATPSLDAFRTAGLLWTKVTGQAKDGDGKTILKYGKPLPDPSYHQRAHCLAFATPLYFNSYHGRCPDELRAGDKTITLTQAGEALSLSSDSSLHRLSESLGQQARVTNELHQKHYNQEPPVCQSWQAVTEDLTKMCYGISMNFKPRTPEDHADLVNEVFLQVSNKLKTKKLVYTPGRAPVFNLLTTTIYRCLYSIMNKRRNQRDHLSALLVKAQRGVLPSFRSLRAQTHSVRVS